MLQNAGNSNYIKSLTKAIAVLRSFSLDKRELGVLDVVRKVGISKPTAYRILTTLAQGQILEKKRKTGKYTIGPLLYSLGSLYLTTTDLLLASVPVAKTLNDLTGEAITVAIRNRSDSVFVLAVESKYAVSLRIHVGSILPGYCCAMGRALLSGLTEEEIDDLYLEERLRPITKRTIASKTELKLKLEQVRKTGVSLDREGVYEGIEGIASVLRDSSGTVVAAMGLTAPVFRMNQARRSRLAALVRLGSSLVSYRLGYNKDNPVRDIEEILLWWKHNQLGSASKLNSLFQVVATSQNGVVEGEQG